MTPAADSVPIAQHLRASALVAQHPRHPLLLLAAVAVAALPLPLLLVPRYLPRLASPLLPLLQPAPPGGLLPLAPWWLPAEERREGRGQQL